MPSAEFTLPEAEREKLAAALDPKQLRQAEYQIVKRTTSALLRIARKEVGDRINAKATAIKEVVVMVPPRGDPPVGVVTITRKPIALIDFGARSSKRGGVRVTLRKDKPPLVLAHAFIATMKTGHKGVFTRARHLPTRGPNVGNSKLKLTPEGFAGRLAIEEQFGPSVYSIVKVPEVFEQIKFDAQAEMQKQAASQLARFAANLAPDTADDFSNG